MKKYQIKEVKEIYNHAGSKAVEDACRFAGEKGYEVLCIRQRAVNKGFVNRVRNQIGFFFDWKKAYRRIEKNSLILLQNPFYGRQIGREMILNKVKKHKKCNIISLVHDVAELRVAYSGKYSNGEFQFMKQNSDYFIIHNDCMRKYLLERGFEDRRMVNLDIFDYGFDGDASERDGNKAEVVIAGNLEAKKCPYIYQLGNLNNRFSINLYGPNYEENNQDEYISYKGSFPSDEVPEKLNGRFGLIWDGEGLDKCTGDTGRYLRYNNPHKASLYLVSGLPIIIWKEAAMAQLVEKNKLGFTVSSLEEIKAEIESMSKEQYEEMLDNVCHIGRQLKSGYYLKKALSKCEERIEA